MDNYRVACGWGGSWLPLNFADEESADRFIKDFCCHSGRGHMVGLPARSEGASAPERRATPVTRENENHSQ